MPARALVTEAGRVTGVIFEREGLEETAEAVRGVVLASGGFGANAEMRRKYIPQADAGWSLQPEGSQGDGVTMGRSEEHTSELQSLMRISYAVFCLKKKTKRTKHTTSISDHNIRKSKERT